jgi:hypothetical protein
MKRAAVLALVVACGGATAKVRLDETWPTSTPDYAAITEAWTRTAILRGELQEALQLVGIFKSPDWRAAHAARVADQRDLGGAARDAVISQAQADMAGPYEIELLVTTWDRRENDLDRGKRSVWHVVLLDDAGKEIEPIEIVKDKRSTDVLRAEFPTFGNFATAYVARYPRTDPVLGPSIKAIRLRMSSERGGVSLVWR